MTVCQISTFYNALFVATDNNEKLLLDFLSCIPYGFCEALCTQKNPCSNKLGFQLFNFDSGRQKTFTT